MILARSETDYFKNRSNGAIGWRTRRGDIYLLCPFHKEKTPSCVIHVKTFKYFICYGCGKSGESRGLRKKFGLNLDFCDKNLYYHLNWFEDLMDTRKLSSDLEIARLETGVQSS